MKLDPTLIEVQEIRTSDSVVKHDLVYAGIVLGPASALSVVVPGDQAVLEADVRSKLDAMSAHERLAFKAKISDRV